VTNLTSRDNPDTWRKKVSDTFVGWRALARRFIPWAVAALALLGAGVAAAGQRLHWGLFAAVLVAVLVLAGFALVERRRLTVRELALVATLAGLAAAARLPFAAFPGVQPTTFLTIASGVALGPWAGFTVGAAAAVVSNFFLGQGPWTPWQMLGWGLAGAGAGALGRVLRLHRPWPMAFYGLAWGYLYGWLVNMQVWTAAFYPLTLTNFLAVHVLSFWFDTAHALANFVFCLVFGREVLKILSRFRDRLVAHAWPGHNND